MLLFKRFKQIIKYNWKTTIWMIKDNHAIIQDDYISKIKYLYLSV